jgi:hypothetical protein
MNRYRLAADGVLLFHAAYIAFVIFGLVAVWVGLARRWTWTLNPWFRIAHLAAIGLVVLQSYLAITCPLTNLENHFRQQAGQDPYGPAGFIEYWLHRMIFFTAPPWVFVLVYTLFAAAVVGTLVLAPPRWHAWRQQQGQEHAI